MALPLWATLGIVKGGTALARYGLSRLQGKPSYLEELERIKEKGIYSDVMDRMTGRVAKVESAMAGREIAARRGETVRTGMTGSVATKRFIREPAIRAGERVSDFKKEMEIKNELSKRQAMLDYARAYMPYEMKKKEDIVNLATGLGEAGLTAYTTKYKLDRLKELRTMKAEDIRKDPARFLSLASEAGVKIPYGYWRLFYEEEIPPEVINALKELGIIRSEQ